MIDLLASYQIERHIRKDKDEGPNRLKKEVHAQPGIQGTLGPHQAEDHLPGGIRDRELVRRAVDAIKRMEKIEAPKIRVSAGQLEVKRGGIAATAMSVAEERISRSALTRARRSGLLAERNGTDPLDAGADSQRIRPAGGVLHQTRSGSWTPSPTF